MTGKEGEVGGPRSKGACGYTSVRDKGLAQRSDSGLTEEQMIKEIARKQHYRIQRFLSLGELRASGLYVISGILNTTIFTFASSSNLKGESTGTRRGGPGVTAKLTSREEVSCQIWFSWPMMARTWSCRAGAQAQLDDVREILRGCDSEGGGSAGIGVRQK